MKLLSRMTGRGKPWPVEDGETVAETKQTWWRRTKSSDQPPPNVAPFEEDPQGAWGRFGQGVLTRIGRGPVVMTPSEQEKAQAALDKAHKLFREEKYKQAGKAFGRIYKQYEDTAQSYKRKYGRFQIAPEAEEALFMQAECEFKQDRLASAQDTYAELLTKFPTTRYLPQAAQRTYDIAYYWLEDSRLRSLGETPRHRRITQYVNLFDRSRPALDTEGRAVEAIELIQQYDPLGPLSDDAVMMAGAHSFVSGDYIQSAMFYEQVVTDQPKSDHGPNAFVLGAQAYLRAYDGPVYDDDNLEDAARLINVALRSSKLSDEQRERLERDKRFIYLEKAKRDFVVAEEYRRMRKPKAARYYYNLVAPVLSGHRLGGAIPGADRAP